MSNEFKDISIRNHIYCFFDDVINTKGFNPINIKIDKKLHRNIFDCIYLYGTFDCMLLSCHVRVSE